MWEGIAGALVGVLVTGIGSYILLGIEIKANQKIAQSQLLIEIDNRLLEFDRLHDALRPNGAWGENASEPPEGIEWYQVDSYMGTFERIYIFVRDDIISKEDAQSLYAYRLENLVRNISIRRKKLKEEHENWQYFVTTQVGYHRVVVMTLVNIYGLSWHKSQYSCECV